MDDLLAVKFACLIPLLPLIGAVLAGFAPKRLRPMAHWPIWIGVGASAILSLTLLFGMLALSHAGHGGDLTKIKNWYTWIDASAGSGVFTSGANFIVKAAAWFDPLTAVMLSVVTGIGFLITVYAAGYMRGEAGYFRFFAYLGLFIFSMTILVMGNNFVMLYLGWEGVGVCSYLLIGYYYEKPAAREAAKKAFLVNRIGDFGFGLGIMLIFLAFGTINFFDTGQIVAGKPVLGVLQMAANRDALTAFQQHALQIIPFLLMLGAFGKSAQFPLYVWLPDAMEGPTPVSALIHAATMVTAGVYMIARCGPIFLGSTAAMATIACIGAFTALLAGVIALRQFDLKKVFAYSTISQLGYMFIGLGVLAPTAAVFHLVTHAFFKALLFLSSGVVMHAMLGHLDMRKMSGLKHKLPWTNRLMLVGCAALAGFPFTSGFFSKDEIIGETWRHNWLVGLVALFTAFLTAYYTFRLYFQVFQGPLIVPTTPADSHAPDPSHDDHADPSHANDSHHDSADANDHEHAHHNPEPMLMIFPLILLAIGALLGGLFNVPGESLAHFLGNSPSFQLGYSVADATAKAQGTPTPDPVLFGQHVVETSLATKQSGWGIPPAMVIGALVSIAGIYLAYRLHLKNRPRAEQIAGKLQPVTGWIEGKFWIDELYQHTIVHSLRELGQAFYLIDRYVVDSLVSIIGFLPLVPGFGLKLSTQRGYLQGYATVMLLGLAAILIFIFVHG